VDERRNRIPEGYQNAAIGRAKGVTTFSTVQTALEELQKRMHQTRDKGEELRRALCGDANPVARMAEVGNGKVAKPGSVFDQLATQTLELVKLQAEIDVLINQCQEAVR